MNEPIGQQELKGALRAPRLNVGENSISTPIPGVVTQMIGSGEHAQNSIVYRTILWSFIGGGLLSGASVVIALTRGSATPFGDVKDVWAIFAPLITLSLGYLFGKGK